MSNNKKLIKKIDNATNILIIITSNDDNYTSVSLEAENLTNFNALNLSEQQTLINGIADKITSASAADLVIPAPKGGSKKNRNKKRLKRKTKKQ